MKVMKLGLLSMMVLSSVTFGLNAHAAEDSASATSKVTASLISGGLNITADDVDLGDLIIGQPIPVKTGQLVTVRDWTGGNGWTLSVNQENYESVKSDIALKIKMNQNAIPITNESQEMAKGNSQLDDTHLSGSVIGAWGATPMKHKYQANLKWTVTPDVSTPEVNVTDKVKELLIKHPALVNGGRFTGLVEGKPIVTLDSPYPAEISEYDGFVGNTLADTYADLGVSDSELFTRFREVTELNHPNYSIEWEVDDKDVNLHELVKGVEIDGVLYENILVNNNTLNFSGEVKTKAINPNYNHNVSEQINLVLTNGDSIPITITYGFIR